MNLFDLSVNSLLQLIEHESQENTKLMRYNTQVFNNRKFECDSFSEKSEYLNQLFDKNSTLSDKNKKLQDLYNAIVAFLREYRNAQLNAHFDSHGNPSEELMNKIVLKQKESISSNNISRDDCFILTVSGSLEMNENHPYVNDKEFVESVFNYYVESEDYESCANMMQFR